jgi:hypothetical protein
VGAVTAPVTTLAPVTAPVAGTVTADPVTTATDAVHAATTLDPASLATDAVHVATAPLDTHALDNAVNGDTLHGADTTATTTATTAAHAADDVNHLVHVL